MKMKHIAKIESGQDGAIFGDYLFRFDSRGAGKVYLLSSLSFDATEPCELSPICKFTLDRAEEIVPHSNSVFFGSEYFDEGDEFPLLYSNMYNNFAKREDRMIGVVCVYRITRSGVDFSSELVGLIKVGFADERGLWLSRGEVADVRPYGNFVADNKNGKLYAFVMRDGDKMTRYFRFAMPSVKSGVPDAKFGINTVTLSEADIEEYFDVPYHNYMQGAIFHEGKIYEVEGFGKDVRSAIRIIDTEKKCEQLYFDFYEAGYGIEPEFIDFFGSKCIYGDAHGNLFLLTH